MVVATLLISTVSWTGTLTLLVIPYVVVAHHLLDTSYKKERWSLFLALLSFLLINSERLLESSGALAGGGPVLLPWLLGLPMYGMIILWLTVARMLLKRRKLSAALDISS